MEQAIENGDQDNFRRRAWAEWNDPDIASAWIRWHYKVSLQQSDLTRLLLDRTGLFVGASVLDIASGTGEPALTIAEQVGSGGRVIATEISQPFIEAIRKHAHSRGLKQMEVVQTEAENLPFPNEWFDVATSRLGVMFFSPLKQAMQEIRRVLKPGGRVALLAWGMPDQGTHYASCFFPFLMRSTIDPPPAEAPSAFRFSPPGSLYNELVEAGFQDASEVREIVNLPWPGPPEELWQHLYETVRPLRLACNSLPKPAFEEAHEEAMAMLHNSWDGRNTTTTAEVVVGSATR